MNINNKWQWIFLMQIHNWWFFVRFILHSLLYLIKIILFIMKFNTFWLNNRKPNWIRWWSRLGNKNKTDNCITYIVNSKRKSFIFFYKYFIAHFLSFKMGTVIIIIKIIIIIMYWVCKIREFLKLTIYVSDNWTRI